MLRMRQEIHFASQMAAALVLVLVASQAGTIESASAQSNGGVGTLGGVGTRYSTRPSDLIGNVGGGRLRAGATDFFGNRGAPVGFQTPASFVNPIIGGGPSKLSSFVHSGNQLGGGLGLSGLQLSGSRSSELLSQPYLNFGAGSSRGSLMSELYRRAAPTGSMRGRPLDRYGMAFARGPINLTAAPLPAPPPMFASEQAAPLATRDNDLAPVAKSPIDALDRTERDANFYRSRALRRFFADGNAATAQLDFDKVRLLEPGDASACVGSCLTALVRDNNQVAMAYWRQALRRFDARSGQLSDLWFDFKAGEINAADQAKIHDTAMRISREIRQALTAANNAPAAALQPRVAALIGYLAWINGDNDVAVTFALGAVESERRLDPSLRSPGIALLYQRLREQQRPTASAPAHAP